MMRIQGLLLFISLLATSSALRGHSSAIKARPSTLRRLPEVGAEKGSEKDSATETGMDKEGKEKEGKNTKSGKKTKSAKSKRCKTAKSSKSKKSASDSEESATIDTQDDEVEDSQDLQYCLHGALSAEECAALENGELPEDDPNVKGEIEMEIATDDDLTTDEIKRSLGDILRKETLSKFVGCKKRRILAEGADEADTEETDEEDSLSVTGVDFQKLAIKKKGCTDDGTADDDTNCNKVNADARVYYTGKDKASPEEKEAMFDLLVEIIETQAATGSFADVGEVKSVGTDSGSEGGGGSGSAMPIGVAVGSVAAVAAVGGLVYYKKRKVSTAGDDTSKPLGDTDSSDEDDGQQ